MSKLGFRNMLLLVAAAGALAGCESEAADPAPTTLKPGFYQLTRKDPDSTAKRFDILVLNQTQAQNWPTPYLKTLQDRLKPRHGGGSYNANDYPCRIGDVRQQGNSFTARGSCNIPSRGEATSFVYSGIRNAERFKINVKINPDGKDSKATQAREIEIAGVWVKDDDKPSGM